LHELLVSVSFNKNRYDSHRDQILRSGERHQAGGGSAEFATGQRPDDEPDLYQFFTASCFSGFGDGPKVCGWAGGFWSGCGVFACRQPARVVLLQFSAVPLSCLFVASGVCS
jgi:hypothetical protein